ncbi:GTP cyclohydrolase [Neiella sp. HB171785]|uniref:GTP cyclohydrolase n=1 Tax=Neiella litorisoli TaxID=2771431 RepID=A0A8J6QN79_9GAMM|nr:YciI family protein [Neiella litorisoli]MBD1387829.1 GTP cyclohydrolase [Neiella litorisoli]
MFIVSITYCKPLEEVDRLIPQHIAFLDEQYRLGHFQLSGRKEPRTGGVILATVKGKADLEQILAQDPFYREQLASYEITEMVPSKSSEALKFLLEL